MQPQYTPGWELGARIPGLCSTDGLIGVPSASQKCDVAGRECPHHQHSHIFCYMAKRDPADTIKDLKIWREGTCLAVQWSRLPFSNVGGKGSIPSQGTKIQHTEWHDQKKTEEPGVSKWTSLITCP